MTKHGAQEKSIGVREYKGKEREIRFFKKWCRGEPITEEDTTLHGIHFQDAVGDLRRPK